jgi:hypothetical protein
VSVADLGLVRLGESKVGRLFAAQMGAINKGLHQGTLIGISSDRRTALPTLLRALFWTRWIRPLVRREERRLNMTASPKLNGVSVDTASLLQYRANITTARRQDEALPSPDAAQLKSSDRRGALAREGAVLKVVELFAGARGLV